ncbi:unnamed protein product [Somion occarium]|uniref:Thioredoxin n=1 Tax=Somion occarium TaxID=3059160 RepID=A0ABP1DYK2_9APHY
MVQEIKNLAEFKEIISGDKVVIIDFWAEWCGPCKQISPIFEKLSADFPNLAFYKVNVDEASDISEEVGIRAMPTFMAFKNGAKIGESVGAIPTRLQELIASAAQQA